MAKKLLSERDEINKELERFIIMNNNTNVCR